VGEPAGRFFVFDGSAGFQTVGAWVPDALHRMAGMRCARIWKPPFLGDDPKWVSGRRE